MLLGAHVSIAGGLFNAPLRGREIRANVIQIFTRNQRQWKLSPLESEQIAQFQDKRVEADIQYVAVHGSYLMNLSSPDVEKYGRSKETFLFELQSAENISADAYVFHPGSHQGMGEKKGIKQIADSLNSILDSLPDLHVDILLETTSGQGTSLGYQFEQLNEMINRVKSNNKVGVCLDTCHCFAAGYDFRDVKSYEATFRQFDRVIGLNRLKVIHLNDSKKPLNSRIDRHAPIGEGQIGIEAFRCIMNDQQFSAIPKILEIPGGMPRFKQDIELLKSLMKF